MTSNENNTKEIILLVDDDSDYLYLVGRYVSSAGYNFLTAADGLEAIELLKANPVDIVITDMMMPNADGMAILEYVKNCCRQIKVLVMTGHSEHHSYVEVITAGATDLIAKPFTQDELLARITRLIREKNLLQKYDKEIQKRQVIEDELRSYKDNLELLVENRTKDLLDSNEQLHAAREAAEAANIAKSTFLANMSHEIRTPLNGVLGMAELALETELDIKQKAIIETIHSEANALNELVCDVLDLAKIESAKLEVERLPFDLRYLFDDLTKVFAYRSQQKGLELIALFAPDIPPKVVGDPTRIRQILGNLVGNAIKFTPEGGEIVIRVILESQQEHEINCLFSVKDTGIGIPQDKQGAIFESFTQADNSTTRKYGGTGLGTAISKQLTELLGGKIGLTSEEGKGSEFWFTIPFAQQKGQETNCSPVFVDLVGLNVLVVDSSDATRTTLVQYLKNWGCVCHEAGSGEEALAMFENQSGDNLFGLVIADLKMKGMSGFDLATNLMNLKLASRVPFILLTPIGMRGDGERCKKAGINGYLPKPVSARELNQVAVRVLVVDSAEQSSQLVTRHTIAEVHVRGGEILLVEDYPANQQIAMAHLSGAGYSVDLAENGQEAVNLASEKDYDLILMDMQMPVMNGYDACRAIRKLGPKNMRIEDLDLDSAVYIPEPSVRVPIISMTANAMSGDREKCLEAGMDDYISKPLQKKQFLAMVEKWLLKAPESTKSLPVPHSEVVAEKPGNDKNHIFVDADLESLTLLYLKELIEDVEEMRKVASAGDYEALQSSGHRVKGSGGAYGMRYITELGAKIETAAKDHDQKAAGKLLEKLGEYIANVKIHCK
nr:response regulator [Desulfobulbaceae bacterium]